MALRSYGKRNKLTEILLSVSSPGAWQCTVIACVHDVAYSQVHTMSHAHIFPVVDQLCGLGKDPDDKEFRHRQPLSTMSNEFCGLMNGADAGADYWTYTRCFVGK